MTRYKDTIVGRAAAAVSQAARSSRLTRAGVRVLTESLQESEVGRLASLVGRSPIGISFVDIVDFTGFTSRFGDGAALEALRCVEDAVSSAASLGRGEVVKGLGDGFLIAFPSPSQAVRAAVLLARNSEHPRWPCDRGVRERLSLRIAVHAGSPIVGNDDLIGHDVNITSRLLDHCSPGQVVVSDPARRLAERRLRKIGFESLGAVELRGLEGRYRLHLAISKPEERRASA